MSILSTSSKLIRVGQGYSAGSGISIDNYVISVTGDVGGDTYSAGDNIGIYEQDDQLYISGKDWTNDIANASANAYNQATAQIPEPFDPSYLSAQVDNKLNSTAFTSWQNGQYSTDLQTIEGQISNKLDKSAFSDVSASFLTAINIPESATWNEVSQAYEQASGTYLTAHQSLDGYATEQWVEDKGYLTGISIPESANWNETTTVVHSNSAQWAEGGEGDEEVNALVHTNSGTWNSVTNKLDTTAFSTVSGDFLTAVNIPESATWDDVSTAVQTNSSTWNDITAYQSNSARYLTGVDLTPYVPASSIGTELVTTSVFGEETIVTAISGFRINAASADWSYTAQTSDWAQSAGMAYRDRNGNLFTAYYQPKLDFSGINGTITAINNSALADGAISSYTTAWSDDVPPYGGEVINSLNGKYLSAYVSLSADNAKVAKNADSATYAQTVDETKLVNDGFVKNLSSEYGTISVVRNTIESTNSAISRVGNEGFVSSYNNMESIGPAHTATYSWDKSLPNTEITLDMGWNNGYTLTYSANTELTGEVVLPYGTSTQTISIPNATEFKAWANDWVTIEKAVVSAADTFETVVGELAWASALPTYQYDSSNKISAINGSAIAAGDEFPVSADEAIQYVQTNSANIDDTVTSYQTNSGTFLTAHQAISAEEWNDCYDNVNTNSGVWGGSALPISAGPGIKVNLVDNTLVFSNDETVLWSGAGSTTGSTINLNESLTHFEKYGLYYYIPYQETNQPYYQEFIYKQGQSVFGIKTDGINSIVWRMYCDYGTMTDTSISLVSGRQGGAWLTASPQEITWYDGSDRHHYITKVVGINRK